MVLKHSQQGPSLECVEMQTLGPFSVALEEGPGMGVFDIRLKRFCYILRHCGFHVLSGLKPMG